MSLGRRTLAILLAAASFLSAAAAASAESLGVEAAVAKALDGNPGLYRARLDLEAAGRAAAAAYNLLYPDASLGAGISRSSSDRILTEKERYTLSGSLSLSLSLSPAQSRRMKASRLAYEAALLSYEAQARALELELRSSFDAILLAKARLGLVLQNQERQRKSHEQVAARYAAGLASELDLLSARYSYEASGPAVEAARLALENGLDSFRLLLGLEPGSPLDLAGDLASARAVTGEAARAALEAAKAKERPSVALRQKALESARAAERLASLGVASPSLSLSARLSPSAPLGGPVSDSGSVSLGLSLPLDGLLPASAERLALAAARDAVAKAESSLQEAARASAAKALQAVRAIEAAEAALASLDRNVALAQKKYDLTLAAYQQGLKSLSDLEAAASGLDSARVDALAQEYALLTKALELENELGLGFGGVGRME
ncbi:MAG TPA: TolC family protein [Spirochaetia bacterium]|nr:TolC family protein [Spirochaetia bacterium]